MSKKEQELREKSYFRERVKEFEGYDNDLLHQTFLSGDGLEYGEKDREIFALVKDKVIDKVKYPNLNRWFNLIKTVYQGDDLKGLNKKLTLEVYLGGDQLSEEDKTVHARLKLEDIDKEVYPNLYRWYNFVKK